MYCLSKSISLPSVPLWQINKKMRLAWLAGRCGFTRLRKSSNIIGQAGRGAVR